MKHNNKYYLVNIADSFKEGDLIIFEMPSFCSGDYTAKVLKDENGLYIKKSNNYFKGCREYAIISNNNNSNLYQ